MAVKGNSFCSSSKDAFKLIVGNASRFGIVDNIENTFVFIGKLFIAAATTALGYLIITNYQYYDGKFENPLNPCIAFLAIGYAIGSLFMNVFDSVADALLIVFTIDEQYHELPGY